MRGNNEAADWKMRSNIYIQILHISFLKSRVLIVFFSEDVMLLVEDLECSQLVEAE